MPLAHLQDDTCPIIKTHRFINVMDLLEFLLLWALNNILWAETEIKACPVVAFDFFKDDDFWHLGFFVLIELQLGQSTMKVLECCVRRTFVRNLWMEFRSCRSVMVNIILTTPKNTRNFVSYRLGNSHSVFVTLSKSGNNLRLIDRILFYWEELTIPILKLCLILSTVPPTSTLQFPPVPTSVSKAPMTSVSLTKSPLLGQKNKARQRCLHLHLGPNVQRVRAHAREHLDPQGRENIIFQGRELPACIGDLKDPGPSEKPYSERTLLYGGIYVYPRDPKSKNRKLRLMYEYALMSFIDEQAGGKWSCGHKRKLTLNIGSKEEMGKLDDVFERFISSSFVDSKIPF
ncbi:LOW QUALITY PROTEIN: hypothetical protein HID58_087170 [Brassica napus]|uniref:D-fructose-1,6-bisphosphate 1-phosphohydrolase n=1 Tax=Brassica napus TaxID=3708 RepID=A0ABQ7XSK6_BRANA|nr:LOW QUALITY PROTEIN: hypothetical protein HID58_087170 [Brassica napus]